MQPSHLPLSEQALSELPMGVEATIKAVVADAAFLRRLHALGFKSGKSVCVVRRAAFNGPMQVRLTSTDVMIRPEDACHIQVQSAN